VINRYCLKHGVSFHALSYEKLRAEDQDEHLHFAKADVLVTASSGVLWVYSQWRARVWLWCDACRCCGLPPTHTCARAPAQGAVLRGPSVGVVHGMAKL